MAPILGMHMVKQRMQKIGDLRLTANRVADDMRLTEGFYYLLFDMVAPLIRVKPIKNNLESLLVYSGWSLDISYIVTLYKIFDKEQLSLPYFITQITLLSDESKTLMKDIEEYNKFIKNANGYLVKIKQIETKLNPMRNTFRAHNYPNRKNIPTLKWIQTKEWLRWGEDIFNEALISVGFTPWAYFLEDGIKDEREFLFNKIKKVAPS